MADKEPSGPFHAGPGTAHEIGVMVGFMAAFVLITTIYLILWRINNKRSEAAEVQRRQSLAEKIDPRNTSVWEDRDEKRASAAPGH